MIGGSSVSQSLMKVLQNRRWQCCTRPFVHYIARDVFVPQFYAELDAAFGELLNRGLSEQHDPTRFSRNIRNYDAYSILFDWNMPEPFRLFISREWHDMLAQLADIPATGDVTGGFHHHRPGSNSGQIHNDLNPGWFVDAQDPHNVNLSRNDLCDYSSGQVYGTGIRVHESVRGLAVLIFLHNSMWREHDGGETGLYNSSAQAIDLPSKAIPPVSNTLLIFECTPKSYHSFLQNRNGARNSMIMWLHRPKSDVIQRWGRDAIVGWDHETKGQPR
ncbi:MAG: 2OG-Fe(II) oxygenase [Acidobacteriaceae bacterium]|nr:2OG-Fe(II) oxygenase [Acidobacteriaceae bacterium]